MKMDRICEFFKKQFRIEVVVFDSFKGIQCPKIQINSQNSNLIGQPDYKSEVRGGPCNSSYWEDGN